MRAVTQTGWAAILGFMLGLGLGCASEPAGEDLADCADTMCECVVDACVLDCGEVDRCISHCNDASQCTINCDGDQCRAFCDAAEVCDVSCTGSDCHVDCGSAQACYVEATQSFADITCSPGCEVHCGGDCTVHCPEGPCFVTCSYGDPLGTGDISCVSN